MWMNHSILTHQRTGCHDDSGTHSVVRKELSSLLSALPWCEACRLTCLSKSINCVWSATPPPPHMQWGCGSMLLMWLHSSAGTSVSPLQHQQCPAHSAMNHLIQWETMQCAAKKTIFCADTIVWLKHSHISPTRPRSLSLMKSQSPLTRMSCLM